MAALDVVMPLENGLDQHPQSLPRRVSHGLPHLRMVDRKPRSKARLIRLPRWRRMTLPPST